MLTTRARQQRAAIAKLAMVAVVAAIVLTPKPQTGEEPTLMAALASISLPAEAGAFAN